MKQLFLSCNFLLGGYFDSSKCLGPAVVNFELMINSLMMNRVKVNINCNNAKIEKNVLLN